MSQPSTATMKSQDAALPFWVKLAHIHDHLYSDTSKAALKRVVVQVSVAGFAAHLALIFLARWLATPPAWIAAAGTNYLAAVSTPFNCILFYEVLTLIAALPASTTRSIANQFEIVSLIFIRDAFKDIAEANEPRWILHHLNQVLPLGYDMWGGLAMFLLATVFQQVALRQVRMPRTAALTAGREKFIAQKKIVAIGLTILLIALAIYHVWRFVFENWNTVVRGHGAFVQTSSYFYNDLFTVMIFTDVLMLILSLVVSGRYEMVFRNAAFVVSIILIRFSLTEPHPFGTVTALLAMSFAILTLLIFNYHSRVRAQMAIAEGLR
jgi:hypothetical protein